ncbi:MAG: sugar ABC transporter ATP-binding protein [Gaiellaceae bacterium MAG52_C11]|nr:sugar ABC transporter ATP-binding protein [Candidatus Gaiellasilicea maunaloa]
MTGSESQTLLDAIGLTKRYGGQVALNAIDFSIAPGELVAVIGENGAGKSTFAKILSGAVRPDAGGLRVHGKPIELNAPRDALRHGISYIPQELAYLPNLTVAENLVVGRWPNRGGLTTRGRIHAEARRIAARFGIELDIGAQIAQLRLAERQLVEIVKALARDVSVIVLDEPTASLTSDESDNLFHVLRGLAQEGVGVIFISHRLDEVFDLADRIVVLRNGDVVANLEAAKATSQEVIAHMLGAAAEEYYERRDRQTRDGTVALALRNWTRIGLPNIVNFTLTLHRGEVLGLFGPRGCGADLIADGLAGRISDFVGEIELAGQARPIFRSTREARAAGLGYVPPERKREGLVMALPVQTNLTLHVLSSVSRFGWINRVRERRIAEEWRDRLQIRLRSVRQPVESLSGGNQQKVLLGSRLLSKPRVLVLNEPTRGVDVGARAEIHRYLRNEADAGAAILWVTSDAEEAVLVSDRLLVMRDGAIVGELSGPAMTQTNALMLATKEAA